MIYIEEFFSERRDPQPTLQSDLLDHKWKWHTTSMTGYQKCPIEKGLAMATYRPIATKSFDLSRRLLDSNFPIDCPLSQESIAIPPSSPLPPNLVPSSINMEIRFLYIRLSDGLVESQLTGRRTIYQLGPKTISSAILLATSQT